MWEKRQIAAPLVVAALTVACALLPAGVEPSATAHPEPTAAHTQKPRCGDGICDQLEQKRGLCPEDCGEATAVAEPTTGASPTRAPGGVANLEPDFSLDVYEADKAWDGITLLTDKHTGDARLIEVNMLGEIVWEYALPDEWGEKMVGFEAELLPNGNVLFALTRTGLYEVDRSGNIVWSHKDQKVSHDADRLPNGNTLYVYGANDDKSDAQVKEVNPDGEIVWAWYAKDHFDYAPYSDIFFQGWSHVNAVTRLENGNTLISIRNFDMIVEVDPSGEVVDTFEGIARYPHDPEVLENGNILVASQTPQVHSILEIDRQTKEVVWRYDVTTERDNMPVRDCNRLPNGNTLITAARKIVEVTPDGEIVWQFGLADTVPPLEDTAQLGFYKAERVTR
jgi:uncharacterized protein (UPF0248 family)